MAAEDAESQCQHWAFTWGRSEWTEDIARAKHEELKTHLLPRCKQYIYQLEKGAGGLFHWQGYIRLDRKQRIRRTQFIKEMNPLLPGIQLRPAHDESALKSYSMKDDTRVDGPYMDRQQAPVYKGEDLPTKLLPWQEDLREYLLGPVNEREIVWIYDEEGNIGKSKFCKYMKFHHDMPTLHYMNERDMEHRIVQKAGKKAYLVDLTRAKPAAVGTQDLYVTLESLKNGDVSSGKYEGGDPSFLPPHVVVFANITPKPGLMSLDRYTIVNCKEEGWRQQMEFVKHNEPAAKRFKARRIVSDLG